MSQETNEEVAGLGNLMYDGSYTEVLNIAKNMASGGNGVLSAGVLFQALLHKCPEHFNYLLGMECLLPPIKEVLPAPGNKRVKLGVNASRILSPFGGDLCEVRRGLSDDCPVDAQQIAAAMLWNPGPEVRYFLQLNGLTVDSRLRASLNNQLLVADSERRTEIMRNMRAERLRKLRVIRERLLACCFGQDDVVKSIITQLGIFWNSPTNNRNGRGLTLFLVGGSGTGKTHLLNNLTRILNEELDIPETEVIDMNRFSSYQVSMDLVGRDTCWKDGGRVGELTERAYRNPRSVIVLENIDKAHQDALSYVDSMVTNGSLLDAFRNEKVSFAENIVIMTTSQDYRKDSHFVRLNENRAGGIPQDKLADLVCDMIRSTPRAATFERDVSNILRCILGKVDDIIPMNDHDVDSAMKMIKMSIEAKAESVARTYDVEMEYDITRLAVLFLDSLENLASANAINPMVAEALCERTLQYAINQSDVLAVEKFRIVIDDLPALTGTELTGEPYSDEWIANRTFARRKNARRLLYDIDFKREDNILELHFTNLRYISLPSIEDAEFFSVTVPDVKADELVGMSKPFEIARDALAHIQSGTITGATPQYGLLLYGPPGTGKTSFAKALARELEMPFIYLSAADLCHNHPAEGVRRVQQVFAAAHRLDAVIFFDEIDALGSRNGSSGVYDVVINTVLTELDGFDDRHVLVIGATNRPECLDPALTRNGRLHTRICLGCLTDEGDRRRLIEMCAEKVGARFEEGVMEFAVSCTYNWAPANMKSLLANAFRKAALDNRAVSRRDVVEALHTENFGVETQKTSLNAEAERGVALHEAGHALVSSLLGKPWVQVTINGGGDALGYLESNNEVHHLRTADDLRRDIKISLAGRAAEEQLGLPSVGSSSDFKHAHDVAARLVDERMETKTAFSGKPLTNRVREMAIERVINECMTEVRQLMNNNRAALESLVAALLKQRVLLQSEAEELIAPHCPLIALNSKLQTR